MLLEFALGVNNLAAVGKPSGTSEAEGGTPICNATARRRRYIARRRRYIPMNRLALL